MGDQQRRLGFEATVASKQPQRSDLTSNLKFMAQTTYTTMFAWTVLTFFGPNGGKKKEHLALLNLSASLQVKTQSEKFRTKIHTNLHYWAGMSATHLFSWIQLTCTNPPQHLPCS